MHNGAWRLAFVALRGDPAAMGRLAPKTAPDQSPEEFMRTQIASGRPGVVVDTFTCDTLEDLSRPLVYRYTARWMNAAIKVRDALQFSLPLRHPFFSDQLAIKATRQSPIRGQYPPRYVLEAKLRIPEGYEVDELPADVVDKTPWCTYRLKFMVQDGCVAFYREVTGLGGIVQPGAEYDEFIRDCPWCWNWPIPAWYWSPEDRIEPPKGVGADRPPRPSV